MAIDHPIRDVFLSFTTTIWWSFIRAHHTICRRPSTQASPMRVLEYRFLIPIQSSPTQSMRNIYTLVSCIAFKRDMIYSIYTMVPCVSQPLATRGGIVSERTTSRLPNHPGSWSLPGVSWRFGGLHSLHTSLHISCLNVDEDVVLLDLSGSNLMCLGY